LNSYRECESCRHAAEHRGYQFFVSHDFVRMVHEESIPRAPDENL